MQKSRFSLFLAILLFAVSAGEGVTSRPIFAQTPLVPQPTETTKAPEVPKGYAGNETPDEPGAIFAPAAPTNFTPAERPKNQRVDRVVIHDIEGTARGAVRWFQDPRSQVSAHYVVDSERGIVWQQVLEKDIGWHAGNWNINTRSIGIEHEGYAYRPGYYSDILYEASARLVRNITARHNIPRDRQHIIAHAEVPHPREAGKFGGAGAHTDPGPYWDWAYYMALVRNDSELLTEHTTLKLHPGERASLVVRLKNKGDDPWVANQTGRNNPSAQEVGPVYFGTAGQGRSVLFGQGWVSPLLAAFAQAPTVAPGAVAEFPVVVQAPRTFGVVEETFRLIKIPPAPYRTVPFGETWNIKVTVEPWEMLWDTTSTGFSATGWNQTKSGGRTVFWQKQPETPAIWQVSLPISGVWEVAVRWTPGNTRTTSAIYEVETATGTVRVPANQTQKAGEWFVLGRFDLPDPKKVVVRLQSEKQGVVVADSVRFIGPFPP